MKSISRYQQLYTAMNAFNTWDEETKKGYLTQFFGLHAQMALDCQEMVRGFCVSTYN